MVRLYFLWIFIVLLPWHLMANNVRITGDVKVPASAVDASGIATIHLKIEWNNSWRDQFNYDAAYIYLKYKYSGDREKWHHVYLMDAGHQVLNNKGVVDTRTYEIQPAKSTVVANRNEGIFLYRKQEENGSVSAQIQLKWQISNTPERRLVYDDFVDGKVVLSAMAVEMVYVPRGAFRLGDSYSNKTFRAEQIPVPDQWNMVTEDYKISSRTPENAANPSRFAANRQNDTRNDLSNAWHGNGTEKQWWMIDFGTPKKVRYFAIEGIADNAPEEGQWHLDATNDPDVPDGWKTLYTGKKGDWVTSLARTYPPTNAIRLENKTAYRYYRIYIDRMPGTNFPAIKNIAMSAVELDTVVNNSVLVSEAQVELGGRGLYADDGDEWSGKTDVNYPDGYAGIFVMKYEISQDQYVAFLNKLDPVQQRIRSVGAALDEMNPGDFVFGQKRVRPSARNGIILTTRSENGSSFMFSNNLNQDTKYANQYDGQTLACNFLSAEDMLAYADWIGLRPLSEMEYEKISRSPAANYPFKGEYAWNSTFFAPITGVNNTGAREEQVDRSVNSRANANANDRNNRIGGPVRCGSFASGALDREMAGTSFWGIMELSGNLAEMYYNANDKGRAFRGVGSVYHGDGKISEGGTTDIASTIWPDHQDAFALRGGCFNSDPALLATSDRTFNQGIYQTAMINQRDSTVTFRLGRTAPVQRILTSVITLQNGQSSEASGRDTVCSGVAYTIKGTTPGELTGNYRYIWYVSENEGRSWDLIEGQNKKDLQIPYLNNLNTADGILNNYHYKLETYSVDGEAKSKKVTICVVNTEIKQSRFRDTLDMYDYCRGTTITLSNVAKIDWLVDGKKSDMIYSYVEGKVQAFYPWYNKLMENKTGARDVRVEIKVNYWGENTCSASSALNLHVKARPVAQGSDKVVCGNLMIDERDGRQYKTIQIGQQCWMAQNLNYAMVGSRCYLEKDENCTEYGRLYNWEQAVGQWTDITIQGICPAGWHLPNNGEWELLRTTANNVSALKNPTNRWTDGRQSVVGTNTTRFSTLPSGGSFFSYNTSHGGMNGYNDIGAKAWWWSSSYCENCTYTNYADNEFSRLNMPGYATLLVSGNTNAFLVEQSKKSGVFYGNWNYLSSGFGDANSKEIARQTLQQKFYFGVRCVKN